MSDEMQIAKKKHFRPQLWYFKLFIVEYLLKINAGVFYKYALSLKHHTHIARHIPWNMPEIPLHL